MDTIAPAGELELAALDFRPGQECDALAECTEDATWRVKCRLGGCWGIVCTRHMRAFMRGQRAADARFGGQRCRACEATGPDLLEFEPFMSFDSTALF